MNHLSKSKWLFLSAMLIASVLWSCSSKETCSADIECKEGFYCGDDRKCTQFESDDYQIIFENLTDGMTVTTIDDVDRSTDDIKINIVVLLKETKDHLRENMDATLSVKSKTGKTTVLNGKFIKNRAVFKSVNLPEGEVTVESWVSRNPALKTKVEINVRKMGIEVFYLKGGEGGTATVLEGATIYDDDNYDIESDDGISIYLTGETFGMEKGDAVEIIIPELKETPVAESIVGEDGSLIFGPVEIPVWKNVRMSLVSGDYSKSISFSVESSKYCGFMLNISNGDILGIANDETPNLQGLQYNLKISEITGCGSGSRVYIYTGDDEEKEPELQKSFSIAGSSVEERVTFNPSTDPDDTKKITVLIEDEDLDVFGQRTVSGIIVDLGLPTGEITFPEAGDILTMADDIDSDTDGLQINFQGVANDTVTPPVSVVLKLQDNIIGTLDDVEGPFSVPYTFTQSAQSVVLDAEITDRAGNSFTLSQPFSVDIDSGLTFYSICGVTGSDVVNLMWLNSTHDEDPSTDELQCSVILKVSENSSADSVSLAIGKDEPVKKSVSADGEAFFDIELEDSSDGILLKAEAFIEDDPIDEVTLTVRVDTVPPVAGLTNNLLLNSGETTSSPDITFNFECSENPCTFNSQLNDETIEDFTTANSRVITGLSDGEHTISVRAKDAAGNISEETVFNWTVDTENPETTITKDPGAGTAASFALFEFESSKDPYRFHCKLEKNGNNFVPDDDSWEECNTGKRDYYGLPEGTYRFRVSAQDAAGNVDPSPAEHVWVVGSAAPVTTITNIEPSDTVTNQDQVEFEFEATVTSTFECKLEKSGTVIEDWTDCSSKTKSYSSLDDGSYLFQVRATAAYGVKENTPASYGWTIDTVPPFIRINSKPSISTPYDSGSFIFECVGEVYPCTFECELDGSPVNCSTGHYSFAGLEEGSHRFVIEATDAAGNKSIPIDTPPDHSFLNDYSWEINPLLLGVTITSKPDIHSPSNDAEFIFESNKTASFECKLNDGSYEPCSSPYSYSGLSEGTHTFTVKASFAEEIAFDSHTWTVDTLDPVITIDSGPADPTNQTGAVFNFSANETVSFECKLSTDADWSPCSSPKVYPAGTFGIEDTEQEYTFEVRGTDQAGNTGTTSYTWTVDLAFPEIQWISPVPGPDGNVVVGKSHDVFSADPDVYGINVVVRVSGSNSGQPINVTGFTTPPEYHIVYVDSSQPKNYTLTIGLQHGARVNNPLVISVEDDTGSSASIDQLVIVNTEMPTITWAYPGNNHKFVASSTAPQFTFNVWNAEPGSVVELIDSDTNNVVATELTVGGTTGLQEYVQINPALDDRCAPYKFHARFYDDLDGMWHYTNSVTDEALKTVRSVTVNRNPAVIDAVVIGDPMDPAVTDTDRILNRAKNMNDDPDGGMQIDITVYISDPENPDDTNRTVKLFTGSMLLATLTSQEDEAVFEKVPLKEGDHTLRVEIADCSGNISSKTLEKITVDTIKPELTLSAPKGSSSNWRWLVFADDPELGTIDGDGYFTGIEMVVNSNEEIGPSVEVIHTVYDYSDNQTDQSDISSNAVAGASNVTIDLPPLEYGKHRFRVTVEDLAGNSSTIDETYEVNVIVPQIEFTNISEGQVFDTDENESVPGFQILLEMAVEDVVPQSSYVIKAIPVLSQGGDADASRYEKTWTGSATMDGPVSKYLTMGGGWWRLSATIKDDHGNESGSVHYYIKIENDAPSITVKKGYGHSIGAGPVIDGYSESDPAWMLPEDVDCSGNDCYTELEIWTDAPAGSDVYISINGGGEISETTTSHSGQSYADFSVTLDSSLDFNTLTVKIISTTTTENEETYYIKIDETLPGLTLINPVDCSAQEVCRRIDMINDPGTDYIELVKLGYGYDDDLIPGGALNFRPSGKIIFEVDGATAGTVKVESVTGDPVPGITNGEATILYDNIAEIYYADFSNMTVADTNPDGQTDYDLVFKVTESPSGAVSKYLVKLHLDLYQPETIDISENLTVNQKTGEVSLTWSAVKGNDYAFGPNPEAVYQYDIRYQDYNEGSCTLATAFTEAKKPLETIAGAVPLPDEEGEIMSHDFFVNRINNGESGEEFKEADIHKNRNRYCFAVRAVDAVYDSDGNVLAVNNGKVLPYDAGKVSMEWGMIMDARSGFHNFIIRNLGDIDGDGLDDFVIADSYRRNADEEDYAGNIRIYFSDPEGGMNFELSGGDDESLGQGISSKADFNGDGFLDFAYTNAAGDVYIHYGTSLGLNIAHSYSFISKDGSIQYGRSMATGDFNGDGCDDIVISAPTASGGGTSRGEVYIYFGRGKECFSNDPIEGDEPDVIFQGMNNNDRLGRAEIHSVGDINGNGKTDFAFSTLNSVYIAYGGDPGGTVSAYTITGLKSMPGYRIGHGDFNGDGYSDLVIGDENRILVYYGSSEGISDSPSMIIDDISPINSTYTPAVPDFAMAVSHKMVDINNDGLSDLIIASDRGLLIYNTINGSLMDMPSVFDPFIDTSSANLKLLLLDHGIVYCNSATNKGDCYFLNYNGE